MPSIFLSHSGPDDRFVAEVQSFLVSLFEDVTVFNDVLSIPAGEEFWPQIERGVHDCQSLVVVVSRHAMNSPWVRREVELARTLNKRIIPLRIDDCDASALFEGRDLVDFRPGRGQRLRFSTKGLPATYTGKLYGRDEELTQLFAALDDKNIRIVAYDAMGGTGKTALIDHFVQQLKIKGWQGLESVFIWSFYSQGSSEDKQTHAADFFKAAYAHFHPQGKEAKLPDDLREQGAELAELIAQQRALLVLDGLEPLQYAAGGATGSRQFGGIKDPGVKALLTRLADTGHSHGLTLITTRIQLHELDGNASFARHHLDQLPTDSAIKLLRDRGIERATFPRGSYPELPPPVRAEFVRAIEDLKNHALSLNLAAHLVAEQHGGQIRAFRDVLPRLHDDADSKIHENHRSPFRVIRAMEAGLYRVLHNRLQRMSAEQAVTDSPAANQLALLYFLALFDRPASLKLLPVVYDAPPEVRNAVFPGGKQEYLLAIEAAAAEREIILANSALLDDDHREARQRFEETFYELSFHYWLAPVFARFDPKTEGNQRVLQALGQLAKQNLVSKARLKGEGGHAAWETLPPGEWYKHHVDCHPLIREYFGHQLEKHYPEAFRAAHERLYDHFRFAGLPKEFQNRVGHALLAFLWTNPQHMLRNYHALRQEIRPRPQLCSLLATCGREEWELVQELVNLPGFWRTVRRFRSDTDVEIDGLLASVYHACKAQKHAEAYEQIYRSRLSRGTIHYLSKHLGRTAEDLQVVACFFDVPFSKLNPRISAASWRGELHRRAAAGLRYMGRIADSLIPLSVALGEAIKQTNSREIARTGSNLCETLRLLGHLSRSPSEYTNFSASDAAEAAYLHAKRITFDPYLRHMCAATHGDLLFQLGEMRKAESRFNEAAEISQVSSIPGFHQNMLFLARRRFDEAVNVSQRALQKKRLKILDRGLHELCIGIVKGSIESIRSSLGFISHASNDEFLAIALLLGANAAWEVGECTQADKWLQAAQIITTRSSMCLNACDAELLRSRMYQVLGQLSKARQHRDQAAALIEKHGYGRRVPDLAVLDGEIDPCLENFQTACAKVGGEGWWHLMPRLEALASAQPNGFLGTGPRKHWNHLLEPLRKAEKAYHAERDAYLRKVEEGP